MVINYRATIIPDSSLQNEKIRLTNQIWKLIPMKEHQENWKSQLYSLLEEIAGLGKIVEVSEDENFLILLAKLEGLDTKYSNDFMIYRKTVFKCIDLLARVFNYDESSNDAQAP